MSKAWSVSDDKTLSEMYAKHTQAQLATVLGRTISSVSNRAIKLGLRKDTNSGRFSKNHATWNKGTSFHAGGRSAETQFKPGALQGNAAAIVKPIGHERMSKDGYLERKINDSLPFKNRWKAVHVLLWETQHGSVPKGHAVIFVNGDKSDIRIENLELISRKDLMKRNSVHNYGPEIASLYQLRGALTRQINRKTK